MPDYSLHSDDKLIVLLNEGDDNAFTEIYNRYWEKLFITAINRLGDTNEAREIVQDIFYKLWKRRANVQLTQSLSIYLASAVKYEVLNLFALKNRHRLYLEHTVNNTVSISDITRQEISFTELKKELELLVNDLPEKCRMVYRLSREAGYSYHEIAQCMNISEKTVEAHLSKALRKLRSSLGHFFNFL